MRTTSGQCGTKSAIKVQEQTQPLRGYETGSNDFVTGSAIRREEKQRNAADYLPLLVEILPTWDIANGPDLAYGLTRAYRMFQGHLLSEDPTVVELRQKLPLDSTKATFDGLLIDEYVACIFGLYSWYETLDIDKLIATPLLIHAYLGKTHFPKASFDGFVHARSKTMVNSISQRNTVQNWRRYGCALVEAVLE